MKILMHENQLCERGTTQALMDYARGLAARGHEIVIVYPRDAKANNEEQVESISHEFQLTPYTDSSEIPEIANGFDAAYFIKAGHRDDKNAGEVRTVVHAVFQDYDPHGTYYAYVSGWLARHMRRQATGWRGRRNGLLARGRMAQAAGCENALAFDAIPHACEMPVASGSLRPALGIPDDAFVILRYGGYETFDIDWVARTIRRGLDRHPSWYFVGVNTAPFTDHPRALFLPPVLDRQEKADLLGSADVFLTARAQGESFGLSHAEALQLGLPVLAWSGGTDRNHIEMLDGLGTLYRSERGLDRLLDAASAGAFDAGRAVRLARGNEYRAATVIPKLEAALAGTSESLS